MSTLDNAGDISHHKRAGVAIAHDAQIGFERGERIVGNLGLGSRYRRQQGGFARIGESHQTHVGKQFQLHNHLTLLARLAGLCIARGAVGRALEMPVAQSATAAFQQHHLLPVVGDVANKLARLGIEHGCSARHLDNAVLACLAKAAALATRHAVGGKHMALIFEVKQCPQVAVAAQNHAAAIAAVATIGSAFRNIFGTMKVCRTSAALSRTAQYFHIVNKIRFCHKSFLIFNNVFRDVFSSRLKNSASKTIAKQPLNEPFSCAAHLLRCFPRSFF